MRSVTVNEIDMTSVKLKTPCNNEWWTYSLHTHTKTQTNTIENPHYKKNGTISFIIVSYCKLQIAKMKENFSSLFLTLTIGFFLLLLFWLLLLQLQNRVIIGVCVCVYVCFDYWLWKNVEIFRCFYLQMSNIIRVNLKSIKHTKRHIRAIKWLVWLVFCWFSL